MSDQITPRDGEKEACKTFIEQIKLLVTLASAFLFAPPSLLAMVNQRQLLHGTDSIRLFCAAEILLVVSVVLGYITLGTVTASQHYGEFDVYRPATRCLALTQFGTYVFGVIFFIWLSGVLLLA